MQFSDIVGQKETKEHLIQTVLENRVSHAQLFLGPEGSGSLALALAYAQFVSCQNRQPDDSCGECSSCRKYRKLIHPDLHFSYPFFAKHKEDTAVKFVAEWREAFLKNPYLSLDEWRDQLVAENKQANINIAECHQIIQKLSLKAFEAEYKIMIMWLPEYLDKEGNTLLKLIEEPPQKTLFLLVAQNQDQILNTIISRTQILKIPRLQNEDISRYLVEKKGLSELKATSISYLSEGSLTAALNFMQEDENDHLKMFREWMQHTYADSGSKIIDFTERAAKLGRENQKNFLLYGLNLIRESVLIISGAADLVHLPEAELEFINKFSGAISLAKAEGIIIELEKAHYHVERNANPKILFLDVSLQLVKILKFNTLPTGTQYIYA